MQRKYQLRREAAYQDGLGRFDELATDPTFRDFVCLYIAEGSKRCRNTVAICNSDPAVMDIGVSWIRRLTDKAPLFAIQYHADQDLRDLREFWGARMRVDQAAIRLQRKSNSNQLTGRTWRSRYGVLEARVYDTRLRAEVQAWMDRLRSCWG